MMEQTTFEMPGTLARALDGVDRRLAAGNLELTLDFAPCTFISVEGIEWLEEILMRADSLSSTISLINVPPSIYKVFKIARIKPVLNACGSAAPSGPVC